MNLLSTMALIGLGFWYMIHEHNMIGWIACMGWASALHNRSELERFLRDAKGKP
jgi:hypothetical protein